MDAHMVSQQEENVLFFKMLLSIAKTVVRETFKFLSLYVCQ